LRPGDALGDNRDRAGRPSPWRPGDSPLRIDRQNNFDLIRLFAALQVLLVHAGHHLGLDSAPWRVLASALDCFPGVPIFFFVSGYLISASWVHDPSLSRYAVRRFFRIYPALWVCFGLTLLLLLACGALDGTPVETAVWVLAQLSIVQFYNPQFLRDFGVGVINGSLWTIPVELSFYVVLPVAFLLVARIVRGAGSRSAGWLLLGLGLVLSAFTDRLAASQPDALATRLLMVSLPPFLYMFAFGVAAFAYRERLLPLAIRVGWWTVPLYAMIAYAAAESGIGRIGMRPDGWLFALLGLAILGAAHSRPKLSQRILRGNDISYGTYIYHMLVVNLLVTVGWPGSAASVLAVAALTLLLAWGSWRLVERPCLHLARQRFHSLREV
jgi:peptidoglycan/LPS O-acetylase OafA/YrhL